MGLTWMEAPLVAESPTWYSHVKKMRCRFVLLIVLCASVSSCSRPSTPASAPKEPSFPAGAPITDSIHFTYSVYLLPGHSNGKQSITFSNQLLRTQYKAL